MGINMSGTKRLIPLFGQRLTKLKWYDRKIFNTDDIHLEAGTIDGIKSIEIIRSYVCQFFDRYLKQTQKKKAENL